MIMRTILNLVNRPIGIKQQLSSISKSQRSLYIQQIQKTKQIEMLPNYSFQSSFKNESKFIYKGYNLNYYYIENTPQPQAIVIFIHGLNMHSQSFSYIGEQVSKNINNLNYYAFDQLNFGKSGGPFRGQIQSLQDSVAQLRQFSSLLLNKFKRRPKIFLAGHSYGGSIAIKMSIIRPQEYDGVILLTPALRILPAYDNIFVKMFIKIMGFIIPRIRLCKYPTNSSTRYNLTEKINRDPLKYKQGIVPKTIKSMLGSFEQISKSFKLFKSPFLGIGAGIEKASDPFGLIDFEKQCQSQDKEVIYFENMWHAINEEQQYGKITQIIIAWLKKRI